MTTKQLASLALTAVVLGGLAFLSSNNKRMKTPLEVGKPVLKHLDLSAVQRLELKDGTNQMKLALASTDAGWVVKSLYNYPADLAKIRANLMKLAELKIGQVATGRKLAKAQLVDFQNASGKSLAVLRLGETHNRAPTGQMAQFGGGGYPDGRYVATEGETVYLVADSLDMFSDGAKSWVDTQIASVPSADVVTAEFSKAGEKLTLTRLGSSWTLDGLGEKEELDTSKAYGLDSGLSYLNFSNVADPALKPEVTGFATGAVYKVTLKDGEVYQATLGNTVGSDRYCQLAASFTPTGTNATANAASKAKVDEFNKKNGSWIYLIASYSAENMQKKRSDLVKAKEPPKPAASKATATSEPIELDVKK